MHYGGCVPFVFACFFFDALIDYSAWNILCWNVRGLNDREKWEPIRNKIDESNALSSVCKKQIIVILT